MTESIDQANKASAKAQAEVKRAEDGHAIAKSEDIRAKEKVAVAQSALSVTAAQLADVVKALAAIDSKARSIDANDSDAIRWLANERLIVETERLAREGRRQREQAQLEQAQAQASAASAAVTRAEEVLQAARDHLTDCTYDDQETRYVAAGEALPQHLADRKTFRERMEEEDHMRKVRWTWELAQREWDSVVRPTLSREKHDHELQLIFDRLWAEKYGGKPASAEPSPPKADESPKTDGPLAAGDVKWKHRASPSHAPMASVEKITGGTEPGWDPFADE